MFLLQTTVSRLTHCTVYLMSTDLILNCEYVVDAGKKYEWEANQWGPNPRRGGARCGGVAPALPLHDMVGVLRPKARSAGPRKRPEPPYARSHETTLPLFLIKKHSERKFVQDAGTGARRALQVRVRRREGVIECFVHLSYWSTDI
ncbi:hypothetical protein TcasGA2_TC009909 [Tribolium castaneum]|uniref:Uncharacterized protein n=1 Tax=Tribolium castaneum TaxID=7070 RepID=D6WQD0_TRICA|nr:hypothetical protein TcasGA2_TC009909 [Tribolium castaneum]